MGLKYKNPRNQKEKSEPRFGHILNWVKVMSLAKAFRERLATDSHRFFFSNLHGPRFLAFDIRVKSHPTILSYLLSPKQIHKNLGFANPMEKRWCFLDPM